MDEVACGQIHAQQCGLQVWDLVWVEVGIDMRFSVDSSGA